MLFTRLGAVVAWLALSLAAFRSGLAIYGIQSAEAALLASRYLGTQQFGSVLDQAAVVAAFAIALGILAEISRALRR